MGSPNKNSASATSNGDNDVIPGESDNNELRSRVDSWMQDGGNLATLLGSVAGGGFGQALLPLSQGNADFRSQDHYRRIIGIPALEAADQLGSI